MPINLDLIHESREIATGVAVHWPYLVAAFTILGLNVLVIIKTSENTRGSAGRVHPAVATSLIGPLAMVFLMSQINGASGFRWGLLAPIALGILTVFWEEKLRQKTRIVRNYTEWLDRDRPPPPTQYEINEFSIKLQISSGASSLLLVIILGMSFIPGIGTYPSSRDEPTPAAVEAATEGIDTLSRKIEERYDVTRIEFRESDQRTHERRVDLLDRAAEQDPWDAPKAQITTADGVYGEYRVVYDSETEQVSLLVQMNRKAEAPRPADLER